MCHEGVREVGLLLMVRIGPWDGLLVLRIGP